jgi:hypothetical protein
MKSKTKKVFTCTLHAFTQPLEKPKEAMMADAMNCVMDNNMAHSHGHTDRLRDGIRSFTVTSFRIRT